MGFLHKLGLPHVNSFSLSPSPSLPFSGWSLGTQRLSVFNFLPGLLRPTQEGAQGGALGHPPLFKRAPVANVDGASCLSWNFIGFPCKPRNISLFLSSIFLSATFFLYLSLNLFTNAVTLRIPWIQLGQDAGMVVWAFFGIAFLWDWNENWPFPVLWPLLSFRNLLTYWVQPFHSIMF